MTSWVRATPAGHGKRFSKRGDDLLVDLVADVLDEQQDQYIILVLAGIPAAA